MSVINCFKILYQVSYPEKELKENYPVKFLVKNFYIYQRTNVNKGRWHLNKKCEGLYLAQNKKNVTTTKIPSLAYLTQLDSSPCRLCAAESYLITTLKNDLLTLNEKQLVFFTGQPNVFDKSSPTNYSFQKITASAHNRVQRIINALDVPYVKTTIGPVGYSRFSPSAIMELDKTFRTYLPPEKYQEENLTFDPDFFWTIYNDNPPELANYLGEETVDAFAGAIAFSKIL